MNATNREENAILEQAKGDGAFEEAEILFRHGKCDGAVSRGYYAAFHYACACLLTKGLEARSHHALQRLFHLHFVRSKIFHEKTGVLLSHAQKAREEADYFPEVTFTVEIAGDRLEEVRQFIATARQYLSQARLSHPDG
ncbi:MAG: HEPN domain-containing protein [Deltaproteobacteria bacterium]|nr:HEPN domain-containing protein [Deltaproteobacteria bacterium]